MAESGIGNGADIARLRAAGYDAFLIGESLMKTESPGDTLSALLADAERVLRPGGWLVVELGYNSRDRVLAMMGTRWRETRVEPDLAGIPRVLAARL